MAVFMFTLTGIPPTAGFFGKFYLFKAAVDANMVWLAVAGVLLSVVSLYYYVRVVATMYLKPSEEDAPGMEQCPWLAAVSLVSVAGVLLLGIFPQSLLTALESIF
jgi:NADH-quinone oxidoreductase subunit N